MTFRPFAQPYKLSLNLIICDARESELAKLGMLIQE